MRGYGSAIWAGFPVEQSAATTPAQTGSLACTSQKTAPESILADFLNALKALLRLTAAAAEDFEAAISALHDASIALGTIAHALALAVAIDEIFTPTPIV